MLHLDTGNTGFMILCTSLVMLMTPGLAFFYGGLVGRKNVLAIMIQSFVSMGDGESQRDERGNRPR
jgi:Amt family ammonium transporter